MVRLKNRYVLCVVRGGDLALRALSPSAVHKTLSHTLQAQHGVYGQARCLIGMTVFYVNMKTGVVIVRVRKDSLSLLSSALPFVSNVGYPPNRVPCHLQTLHVGGSIRSCQKFLIEYHRKTLQSQLAACVTNEERQRVRAAITSTCFSIGPDKDVDADLDLGSD
uniref:Ribonuclease P/MRP protein subunit POP5 n=1 Tax=Eptatretus burgeri TaxID=7764 RepID=A0A8C4R804_EPTBU